MIFNKVWILGRLSENWYIRFFPNPGFMFPWGKGKMIVYNWHDGWFTRPKGSRYRPKKGR